MSKKYLFGTIVTLLITGIAAILVFAVDWADVKIKEEIRDTVTRQEIVKAQATEALKSVVDVANELSGITSGAVFNFEIDDMDGRSANFGIVRYVDEVKGEWIVEEHTVTFRETSSPQSNFAEVDRDTNRVISMHRPVPDFAASGDALSAEKLEAIARQFVERVYPEFANGSRLEFDPGSKNAPAKATNYFYRWNDKQFAVPDGLDMDIPPFIQVGITSTGFIFSYDNTVQLYRNLPKEALRTLCGFFEMPFIVDSSLDPKKGEVVIWFGGGQYLVLPFEPETDFEGCSESAKSWLRMHPYLNDSGKN
ncbi:MAG: hypothetical protein COW88_00125 [Candidatus Lloydbacteria bacterium CG22_combo_CG10-13_8_21_14_all_47_15]|uniref:Uncharacterized protein n=1 Tax=Candidatus Lloydbacteria bacterium CG22_combo_CG10-13_8_21_14_all_47_15 TaxID=1974635 RepID=A0A2H0CX22_9BACT|nr:MAG: hypothetical protein COW88_00125 [Candidatus Lloydbacteria bacterium CG22_combo_CG10-13_8_21_14_all_47_15]